MPDKSPPRRFQFRLRTLMIVVTLLAVPLGYVGWQARIVRERESWRVQKEGLVTGSAYTGPSLIVLRGNPAEEPGFVRRWLGDFAKESIKIPASASDEEVREAISLFPEAKIMFYRYLQR